VRRSVGRAELAAAMWPDLAPDKAANNLRVNLHHVLGEQVTHALAPVPVGDLEAGWALHAESPEGGDPQHHRRRRIRVMSWCPIPRTPEPARRTVNYSLFWRIVLGGHSFRPPKETTTQNEFDFRSPVGGALRAVWTSGSSTGGRVRITAS
jgi:hypothetical protein